MESHYFNKIRNFVKNRYLLPSKMVYLMMPLSFLVNSHKIRDLNWSYLVNSFVTTVDSLITHTLWWTAQGMGFQGVWTSRRGQTKAKQINYCLKIQKKNQRIDTPCCTMLWLLKLPECTMMRL